MLKFDENMWEFIDFASSSSIIGQIFANSNSRNMNLEGNFVGWKEGTEDMVTYLPVSKFDKVEDVWNRGRTSIKIGRFVRKFLNEYAVEFYGISDSMIEDFVNMFKSFFTQDESRLQVVSGADILRYYREDSYHVQMTESFARRGGTLWNSCMRQHERNIFMKLYAENESVKMLVYFDELGKVRARALLWEDVREHGNPESRYRVMDRIYYFYDHDVKFFQEWAKKNGYLSKHEQTAKSERIFRLPDGEGTVKFKELYVMLENSRQEYYPYLDTFKFYKESMGRFSNSDDYSFDYVLVQSSGARERLEEPSEDEDLIEEDED